MVERFKGKIVIVTGSASGIGEAAARRFVAEGAKVALVDCNKDALEKVARSLPADQILVQAVDVSDSSAVDGLVAAVVDRFGRQADARRQTTKAESGATAEGQQVAEMISDASKEKRPRFEFSWAA